MYHALLFRPYADSGFTWMTDFSCLLGTACVGHCYERPATEENITRTCNPQTYIYIRCGVCKHLLK